MLEFGLYLIGGFLLYLLILPLFGMVIGGILYIGLPYSVGIALASITHNFFHGSFFDLGAFWIVAIVWAVLLVHTRTIHQKVLELEHSWHEGHYLAATTILLMGHPYRKAKRVIASS